MPDKSFDAVLKEYGYLGSLAASVPELKALLQKAYKEKWASDEFARNVQDSKWWKGSADSVKQNQILKATKPGEWKARQNELVNKTRLLAAQMGVGLGEGAKSNLGKVVNAAMAFGWDETQLKQEIARYWKTTKGQPAVGTAGQIGQKMRAMYTDYGLGFNDTHIMRATKNILQGKAPLETYEAQLREQAAGRYAGWAEQIRAGMTVTDLAEPYRQSMAQLLELPPDQVRVADPTIQRALVARDDKGQPTTVPLWQFEQQLRKDPRRDKTKGAANEAYDVLREIGKGWGYL